MWEVEMEEDALYGGGQSHERDESHLAATGGAEKGEYLIDPGRPIVTTVDLGRALGARTPW